jgi:hypothetical protein
VQTVQHYFPGALEGSRVLEQVMRVLEPRGVTAENTLFAQSICPDEINHLDDGVPNLFAVALGEKFHIGGLGGLPFCGQTGFHAFSAHVPNGESGVVFCRAVLFAMPCQAASVGMALFLD